MVSLAAVVVAMSDVEDTTWGVGRVVVVGMRGEGTVVTGVVATGLSVVVGAPDAIGT